MSFHIKNIRHFLKNYRYHNIFNEYSLISIDAISPDAITAHYGDLMRNTLNIHLPDVTMEMSNRVYSAKNIKIQDNYSSAVKSNFGGNIESVEFEKPEETAKV